MNQTITKEDLERYRAHLICLERSDATVEKYLRDMGRFAAWLGGDALTKESVVCWREHLLQEGRSPVAINAALAAINGFLGMLGKSDCRARFMKVQRSAFREKSRELSKEEYERLVNTAWERGKLRLSLLLETICATGVRVSEVRYFTVEAARQGSAEIRLKGKIRTILLPNKLSRKLLKYAEKHKITSGPIFRTRTGKPLSRQQIWAEMKKLCDAANVEPTKVFPHNLRHLFATVFYRACHDIVKLADVLGHSSINTTRIYLMTTGTEHRKQLDRLRLIS